MMVNLQELSKAPTTSTFSLENRWGQQCDSSTYRPIIVHLIEALLNPAKRDSDLAVLYQKMELFHENLALLLWNSFGSMWILLQEITSVCKLLSTPYLTQCISIRASHAVGLFKCIASHPATRMPFLRAGCLWYIDPFLETKIQGNQPHENLRTASLDVIAGLVTYGDAEVVHVLLETKIFPWCITCMKVGNAESKSIAAYIVHTILKNDAALQLCCSAGDKFCTLLEALISLFKQLVVETSPLLLKHVILCCLMLTKNARALDALRGSLPQSIRYRDLSKHIDDPVVMNCLTTRIRIVTSREMHLCGSTRR